MEELVRDVAQSLKRAIAFLEKVKVDKKLKPEKDDIINNLRNCERRCGEKVKVDDEETYNDVVAPPSARKGSAGDVYNDVAGESYDDVATGPRPPQQEEDNVYEDNSGEAYDDVAMKGVALIECEKLTRPAIADFIEIKKSKASILSSTWQKRWCVVHNKILYIYDSAKDKQQKEALELKNYRFQQRDDITKESKRKDRCFEMKSSDKSFEFCASDKESVPKWKAVLQGGSGDSGQETYDDVGHDKPKKKGITIPLFGKKKPKSGLAASADDENAYDDTDGQTYQDTANDTNYDDTGAEFGEPDDDNQTYEGYDEDPQKPPPPPMLPAPNEVKQRRASNRDGLPPLPSPTLPPGLPSRNSPSVKSRNNDALPPPPLPGREEIGSGSGTFHKNRPPMPIPPDTNNRALPPPPSKVLEEMGRSITPPPPAMQYASDDEFSNDSLDMSEKTSDDYENMYQGMWDCEPDEGNELRFKRGEVVHIISREYDDYGWWVAEAREDEIGLVPVSYLMKAYDI